MKRICSALLSAALCLSLVSPALAAEGQTVQVSRLNGRVVVDGVQTGLQLDETSSRSPLLSGDTLYITLTAAEQWLGADVACDESAKAVTITHNGKEPVYYTWNDLNGMGAVWDDWEGLDDPSQRQSARLRSDVAIIVDGKARSFNSVAGEPVYPLQFDGYTLLPLEVIGELTGKQKVRLSFGFADLIMLFDPPTKAEYDEAKAALAAVRGHLNAVRSIVKGEAPKTENEFVEKLRQAQEHMKAVWTMPSPAFEGIAWYVEELRDHAELTLWEHIDPYLPVEENSGASPLDSGPQRMITWEPVENEDGSIVYRPNRNKAPAFDLKKFWNAFTDGIALIAEGKPDYTTYFLGLENTCTESERFLSLCAPALAAEERQTVTVSQSFPEVYIEGTRAGMLDDQWKKRAVLSIDGTVYVPLKTAGLWMGAVTAWDEEAGTVTLTSTGAEPFYYSVKGNAEYAFPDNRVPTHAPDNQGELLRDVTVTVNGQAQSFANVLGQPVYPLLFHDCVYLPVRSVARWLDKQVLWTTALNRLGEVHIYSAPTQEELDGARAYLDTVQGCVKNVRAILEGARPQTEEEYLDKARAIQSDLETVWTLPAPDFLGFAPCVDSIQAHAELTLGESVNPRLPREERSAVTYFVSNQIWTVNYPGKSFSTEWKHLYNSMTTNAENTTTYFMNLERACAQAEDFLNMVISAQPTV